MPDFRRLNPRLTEVDLESTPFVPELSPVVDRQMGGELMTRPWLDWARRLTLLVSVKSSGGGGGTGESDPTHVVGPGSAVTDDIALYDGSTGKLIKDSLKTIAQVITDAVNQAVALILPGGKLPLTNLPLHHTTHSAGSADPVTVTNLAGYPGGTASYLRADGTFATPTAGVPGPHHATHEPGGGDALVNAAWTDRVNTFTATPQKIGQSSPAFILDDISASSDSRVWNLQAMSGNFTLSALNAAGTGAVTGQLYMQRNGDTFISGNLSAAGSGGNVACKDQANTFTQNQTVAKAYPQFFIVDTPQPANQRVFDIIGFNQQLFLRALTDDLLSALAEPLVLDRAGNAFIGANIYEKGRSTSIGHWQDVPFSASNFQGGGWTVAASNVAVNRYTLIGKTMHWQVSITASTINIATGTLLLVLPSGIIAGPGGGSGVCKVLDVAWKYADISIGGSVNYVSVNNVDYATFTPGANFYLYVNIAFEIA